MISFVGVSETQYNFAGTSISAPIPAGAAEGHQALAFIAMSSDENPALPGWTLLFEGAAGSGHVAAWSKILDAADIGSDATVTTTNTGNLRRNLHILVYSGCAVANSAQVEETTTGTTHTAPALTSLDADTWVVNFYADRASPASISFTLPGNLTERGALYSDGSGGTVSSIVGDDDAVGTGSVGANTVTGTTSTNNANSSTILLSPVSSPLAVSASVNQQVQPSSPVSMSAVASGGSGAYVYSWVQLSGPAVSLTNDTSGGSTFTAPATVGVEMVFEITVHDGDSSVTDTTAVTVASSSVFAERFNGGTDGEAITPSNSAFGAVHGTVSRDAAWSVTGMSAKFDTGSGTYTRVTAPIPSSASPRIRWYPRFDSIPASNTYIAGFATGTAQQADVRLNSDGTLSLRDGFVAVADSTTVFAAGDVPRLMWRPDSAAGTQSLDIYTGANLHGDTPDETLTGPYSGESINRFRLGCIASPPASWVTHVDDIAVDTAADPGPSVLSTVGVDAGSDHTVSAGAPVTLTATPSGGTSPYTYVWTQQSGPSVSYEQSGATATFTAPQQSGEVVFGVTATDSVSGQAYDEVTITVRRPTEWSAIGGVWVPRTLHSATGGVWV